MIARQGTEALPAEARIPTSTAFQYGLDQSRVRRGGQQTVHRLADLTYKEILSGETHHAASHAAAPIHLILGFAVATVLTEQAGLGGLFERSVAVTGAAALAVLAGGILRRA